MDLAKTVDIALVGIGGVSPVLPLWIREKFILKSEKSF